MEPVVLLRFDEQEDALRPDDVAGSLSDLEVVAPLAMPAVVDGVMGKARSFVLGNRNGLVATDVVPGSTLLNRDISIQAILSWDLTAQSGGGTPGTIYARGKGTAAPEYCNAGLEIRVVNATNLIGELRWLWHDAGGVLRTQVGGQFQTPGAGSFVLLTATRRWVSSTQVLLRYYLADELLSESISGDGSIGGGTTGTTQIGTRFTGAAFAQFFAGKIDELRVLPRELCAEEIAMTWARITKYQPRAYDLLRDLHDPGFPISDNPASDVQRETRMMGHALGFAAAQAENLRANILPDRAYGEILSSWENVTAQSPKLGDDLDKRRSRVVARLRQRAGFSIPGAGAALAELAATAPSNLQFLAFDQTFTDSFAVSLDPSRWDAQAGTIGTWSISAAALRGQLTAGTALFSGGVRDWSTLFAIAGGNGKGAHALTKIAPTAIPANAECGVAFGDICAGNYLLMGLRNAAGTFQVITEQFLSWVSQGVTVQTPLGGLPAAIWFHLWQQAPPGASLHTLSNSKYSAAWSLTSSLTGYTTSADITHPSSFQWAGPYLRTFGAAGTALDVKFDDFTLRAPYGDRSFYFYVLRDPALAGNADTAGAHNVLQGLKQAHTIGTIITSKSLLCDDPNSLCDRGPMGAI